MEGQLYPYAAGGTVPPAAEQAGYYNAPVTALAVSYTHLTLPTKA